MTMLEIGGRRVEVGDNFKSLSPEEQQRTVDEIASSFGQQAPQQPQPVQAQTQPGQSGNGFLEGVNAFTGGVIEGVPIAGPYIKSGLEAAGAGINSVLRGTSYADERARMDEVSDQAAANNPWTATAGNVTGAVGSMIPVGMTALGARALGFSGPSLLARTAAATTSGGVVGGADAAVRSGGDLAATAQGAAFGLGFGAIAPAAGQVVGAGVNKLATALMAPGSKGRAATAASRALADDGLDPTTARTRLSELGDDAMLADLGPNLQRQAGAIAATPGRGQKVVRGAIATRQKGAGTRVTTAANTALGGPVDAVAAVDDIIASRAAAAKPAYEAAYEAGDIPVWSPTLERLSGSPTVQNAMRSAVNVWRDVSIADGFGAMNPGAVVEGGGNLSFLRGKVPVFPNIQFWDYTKRILDDKVRVALKAGQNQKAATLTKLVKMLREDLDSVVPSYKAARDAYAGPSAIKDALEEGQAVFSKTVSPGALRKQLKELSASERDAFVQGARAQIAALMGTARNNALQVRQAFDADWNKEKLQMIIGRAKADELLKRLDGEGAFTSTRDVVTANSETAARVAAQKELGGGAASENTGIIRSLLNMRFGDAGAKVGDMVTKGARASRQANTRERLAEMLTRGGAPGDSTLDELAAALKRGDKAKQIGGRAGKGAHIGIMGFGQTP